MERSVSGFVFTLTLAVCANAGATPSTSTPPPAQVTVSAPTTRAPSAPTLSVSLAPKESAAAPSVEVQLLQAELAQLKSFQSDLLTAVWGAIGVLTAVVAIASAASYFNNQRERQRDIEDIRAHMDRVVAEGIGDAQSKLNQIVESSQRDRASFSQMALIFCEALTRLEVPSRPPEKLES